MSGNSPHRARHGAPLPDVGYSIGPVWYVNAVIEDWPATGAERRALREWEMRNSKQDDAGDGAPQVTGGRTPSDRGWEDMKHGEG
ncbi:hypothetical protein GCM10027058_08470 [Microbacterium neimengense]